MTARLLLVLSSIVAANLAAQTSLVLNDGWRFARGEQSAEAAEPGFDDSSWQQVRVPHDWAIEGPFDPELEDGSTGKLPWKGSGWYRRTVDLSGIPANYRFYLDFDGVMAFPQVYVNGKLAGEWDYGYTSFRVDISRFVSITSPNTIAVKVDTTQWGSRWYPGAGIYRKVTLVVDKPIHIEHWATFVTTNGDELAGERPDTVTVRTSIRNFTRKRPEIDMKTELLDPAGKVVHSRDSKVKLPQNGSSEAVEQFKVENPRLWDVDDPALYTVRITLVDPSPYSPELLDVEETRFGFRTFAFTADDGFHLNGRRVQLKGVNLHHDQGPLGGAFYKRAAQRQLEIMKEMGINALRTSHNPPAPEMLELCDEMGIVVWDEVFDKWDHTAGRHGEEPPLLPFAERQISSTVMRDRNHPSVVVWSHGNELPPGGMNMTPERMDALSALVRKYDSSRPVAQASHIPGLVNEPNFDSLDVTGWNYARRYAEMRKKYPQMPIVYSESASALSTRGFYELPLPRRSTDRSPAHQVDSYDLNAADWSDIADKEFALMEQDSFVAGEFIWTGFDYLGEPTPYTKEARSSYFGIVDLCGFPKDRFYLYRSYWRPEVTTIHILPHWNWPDRVGKNVPVFVYTNGDSAELFLNGKSLGVRRKGEAPDGPENLALGADVRASSGNDASDVTDDSQGSSWKAEGAAEGQWLEVDLGAVRSLRSTRLCFTKPEKFFAYSIEGSVDGKTWVPLASKPTSTLPRYSGPLEVFHDFEAEARYVRIKFAAAREDAALEVAEWGVYPAAPDSAYFDVTYRYRLRWNEVVYQPGELRAVAYKDGEKIGEQVLRTAGPPARLKLDVDRPRLSGSGDDLAYITVEALDADGNPAPLADDLVNFKVDGPAVIAAVGNGNPISYEPFQAPYRKLFYGKALLILRPTAAGAITVSASADGLSAATAELTAE